MSVLPQGYHNLCLKYDSVVHHATMKRSMRLGRNDMLVPLPLEHGYTQVKIALVYECEVIAVLSYGNYCTLFMPHNLVYRDSYWQRIKQLCYDHECSFDVDGVNGFVVRDHNKVAYKIVSGMYLHTATINDGIVSLPETINS